MNPLTSFVRALFGPKTGRARQSTQRVTLGVQSLEGRALPSASHAAVVHHQGAHQAEHRQVEHGPEVRMEHAKAATSTKSKATDDHGAHRRPDNSHDVNDDRGAGRREDRNKEVNDDRGVDPQHNEANDDRGGRHQDDGANHK